MGIINKASILLLLAIVTAGIIAFIVIYSRKKRQRKIKEEELLGHSHSKTTEIYTHVSTKSLGKIRSPLDNLNLEGGEIDKI